MKTRKPALARPRPAAARFPECTGCDFFRVGNTHRQCRGCDAGENFEPFVDELDPDTDTLFGTGRETNDD